MENLPNNTETTNESTGWENMDEGLQPIIDVDQSRTEIEATPEDYEHFSRHYFSEQLGALDNPQINASPEDEQGIQDQIAVTASLLVLLENPNSDLDLSHPKEIFDYLTKMYDAKAEDFRQDGKMSNAERNHRFANAVDRMATSFQAYYGLEPSSTENAPTNTPESTTNQALGGDVIS